jgi:tetratricopeptide (TPR) repeat protein
VLGADKKVAITVLGPDWCDDLFLQAYAYTELKQPAKAEAALREALDLSPMNSHYASELGYVVAHTGRLEEGMQLYRKAEDYAAMATPPDDKKLKAAALRGQGWILVEKKDWAAAEHAYRKSLELDPDSEVAASELQYIAQNRPRN